MRRLLLGLLTTACGAAPVATTDDATSPATTTADPTSSTTGAPTTSPTDVATAGTATEPTTDADPFVCDPAPAPLPEAEFATAFAAQICAQKQTCGCDLDFICEATFTGPLAAVQADAGARGLVYDGDCAARTLAAFVRSRGCDLASAQAREPCDFVDCRVFTGTAGEGDPCELVLDPQTFLFTDDCLPPARCHPATQTCKQDLYPDLAEGEPCYDPMAPPQASVLGLCVDGTGCDINGSNTCEPRRPPGESCADVGLCDPDLGFCDDGVCAPLRLAGEPCTGDLMCASRRCDGDACRDGVWICDVVEPVDIFSVNPDTF